MKEPVSKRFTWEDIEPFPDNPIYEGRLAQMGMYDHTVIGTPAVFDNSAGAFPGLPKDVRLAGDCNHRRALALRAGKEKETFIALLYRGMSLPQMHRMRRKLNDRRTIKPAEKFLSFVGQGDTRRKRIKRTVEGLGWSITHERAVGGWSCTNELEWIDRKDSAALPQAILSYEGAWGRMPSRSQARVLKGLGAFWIVYPHAELDRLVKVAGQSDVEELFVTGRANVETQRRQTRGKLYGGIAWELTLAYNQALRGKRLLDVTKFWVP